MRRIASKWISLMRVIKSESRLIIAAAWSVHTPTQKKTVQFTHEIMIQRLEEFTACGIDWQQEYT